MIFGPDSLAKEGVEFIFDQSSRTEKSVNNAGLANSFQRFTGDTVFGIGKGEDSRFEGVTVGESIHAGANLFELLLVRKPGEKAVIDSMSADHESISKELLDLGGGQVGAETMEFGRPVDLENLPEFLDHRVGGDPAGGEGIDGVTVVSKASQDLVEGR